MDTRPSLTAQGIAIMRAVESEKSPGQRLFNDPYARRFVNPVLLAITRLIMRSGYAEWRGPGVQGFLLARTRYIDDYLLGSAAAGLEQLVILGAGYDARAYRFAAQLEARTRVFEVDHPATQQVKTRKLLEIFGHFPAHVCYVAVDFNRDSLGERLAAAGYDSTLQTLFIWEGVTMYLAPEAVDATLAFVAHHSGARSTVIFDYIYRSVIEGRVQRGEAAGMRRYRRFTGEGLVFGLEEGTEEPFLARRGFGQVRVASAQDLQHLYFADGPQKGRQVAPVYAIASAEVLRQ